MISLGLSQYICPSFAGAPLAGEKTKNHREMKKHGDKAKKQEIGGAWGMLARGKRRETPFYLGSD